MWNYIDTWIVVAGVLSACSCALLGNFLVLRKMSMMGDAISHAVLPGLAVAFLITNSRASITMFIGAAVVGVLTAVFTQWVNRFGRVDEGAAMGVVFTTLFAIGLILIVQAANHVDLDPGCVLYGAIELTPLTTNAWGIPEAVVVLGVVLVINLCFVILFFKELKISSFDGELADTLGINSALMHYLLMTLVAVTTVASFESVGSILVIAMMIVPAASAHLLTDRLKPMIVISLIIAVVCGVGGHLSAITLPKLWGYSDTSTAGMMSVVAGLIFTVTIFVAPRHGIISKLAHQNLLGLRVVGEDILGLIYRQEEIGQTRTAEASRILEQITSSGPLFKRWALRRLKRNGKVEVVRGQCGLTEKGRLEAGQLIRSHRLWESYFFEHTTLPADHVHAPAEKLEHITSAEMRSRLEANTDDSGRDPHGKFIPEEREGQ